MIRTVKWCAFVWMACGAAGLAQTRQAQQAPRPAAGAERGGGESTAFPAPPAEEKTSKTQHTMQAGGQRIPYTAIAGTMLLKKDDDKPKASIFYVSYTRDDTPDKSHRPITFIFNGGPGSSSVWLHMGAFGPKRVKMGPEGEQPAPPYELVDNDDTLLPVSDMVFIDPVTTGFSRQAPGENPEQFHGLEGDLSSVGDFIRLYLTKYERWSSPKYLAGESYGTTRAAGLSLYLLENEGIYLNGITLISSVLNFETLEFTSGNDLPYALFLPSFTAAAWYHKKLPADLQGDLTTAVQASREFAAGDYTLALMKGDRLTPAEKEATAKKLARFTGLSEQYILLSNLRVSDFKFFGELLRGERRTIGRYDSRLTGIPSDAAAGRFDYDPSYSSVQGAYTNMFNAYVRGELKFESDMPYEILTGRVRPWPYPQNRFVDVSERLRQAINQNPNLHVIIANGYYDLATPFFATEYTVHHMLLDPTVENNVSLFYCDAGHMLYTKKTCLDRLRATMDKLYAAPAGGR